MLVVLVVLVLEPALEPEPEPEPGLVVSQGQSHHHLPASY
jgi:hypothetical protein